MTEPKAPSKDITKTWDEVGAQATAVAIEAPGRMLTDKEKEAEALAQIENQLFEQSAGVMKAMLDFDHFSGAEDFDGDDEYVQKMVEMGITEEKARRMARVARLAHLPGSAAPVALKYAASTLVGILKAKAGTQGMGQQINIGKAYIAAELPRLGGREVDE